MNLILFLERKLGKSVSNSFINPQQQKGWMKIDREAEPPGREWKRKKKPKQYLVLERVPFFQAFKTLHMNFLINSNKIYGPAG